MSVLDTNVVFETTRPQPDASVAAWLASQPVSSLFISTVTKAELLHGVALLPGGRRQQAVESMVRAVVYEEFHGRVLPFDSSAAETHASIAAARPGLGRPSGTFDAKIAAIARSRGAGVATRDVAGFADCGIQIVDPWAHGGQHDA